MRIDWYGNVLYPHEICSANLRLLGGAVRNLKEQRLSSALRKLYQVDNNAYAFNFDEEVYRHFTDYVFHQPKDRLKWGYGRLPEHENLYGTVKQLLTKRKTTGDVDRIRYEGNGLPGRNYQPGACMQQACGQPDEYRATNGEICDRDIRIVMMARAEHGTIHRQQSWGLTSS